MLNPVQRNTAAILQHSTKKTKKKKTQGNKKKKKDRGKAALLWRTSDTGTTKDINPAIETERQREKDIYIYIYMYIGRGREREREKKTNQIINDQDTYLPTNLPHHKKKKKKKKKNPHEKPYNTEDKTYII
jgi:hypothetical protein